MMMQDEESEADRGDDESQIQSIRCDVNKDPKVLLFNILFIVQIHISRLGEIKRYFFFPV